MTDPHDRTAQPDARSEAEILAATEAAIAEHGRAMDRILEAFGDDPESTYRAAALRGIDDALGVAIAALAAHYGAQQVDYARVLRLDTADRRAIAEAAAHAAGSARAGLGEALRRLHRQRP